jgi:hypothetical protein
MRSPLASRHSSCAAVCAPRAGGDAGARILGSGNLARVRRDTQHALLGVQHERRAFG